ncbi:MAG: hypothetical protein ACTHMD_16885 [Flavisolibacter sp.]
MQDIKLDIVGVLSEEKNDEFKNPLQLPVKDDEVVLFCDYSNFDIPIGYKFCKIEDRRTGQIYHETVLHLKNVTQEFASVFDKVPKGFKTICKFKITGAKPELIFKLPHITDWYESESSLQLS